MTDGSSPGGPPGYPAAFPVDELAVRLDRAGFDVVETVERSDPGVRPHGAINARRRAVGPA